MDVSILRAAAMDALMDRINSGEISGADLVKIIALETGEASTGMGVDFVLRLVDGMGADDGAED